MRGKDWLIAIILLVVVAIIVLIFWGGPEDSSEFDVVSGNSHDRIGVVEILGPIFESKSTLRLLEQFQDEGDIKGLLVRIDSPGGAIAPTQEIHEEINRMRNHGLPVVVSMGTVAASGGYWIACAADTIVANPGTTTGSIGVIAQFAVVEKLLSRWGVEFETFKTGPFKDTGNPYRQVDPEEREWVQDWIDDAFEQFVEIVADSRNLPIETVREYATGRVYTGRQALEMGLVDQMGNFNRAVELLADLAGIEGKPKLVYKRKPRWSLWNLLTEDVREWIPELWLYLQPFRYQ
jgi:protease-4